MSDNIISAADFINFNLMPPVAGFVPCNKTFCTTAAGKPYFPRKHVCLREGCGRMVESMCPTIVCCSEFCFCEARLAAPWSAMVDEIMESPPVSEPVKPENIPKKKVGPPATEERKQRRKEVNGRYYEKIKQSGKVHIYRQRFVQNRREKRRAERVAATQDDTESNFS